MPSPVKIRVYVSAHDKAAIEAKAAQLQLSVSSFMGRLALSQPLPEIGSHQAIRDLLRVNADQGRLGNLLKLVLDDEQDWADHPQQRARVMALLADIRNTQDELKAVVRTLRS